MLQDFKFDVAGPPHSPHIALFTTRFQKGIIPVWPRRASERSWHTFFDSIFTITIQHEQSEASRRMAALDCCLTGRMTPGQGSGLVGMMHIYRWFPIAQVGGKSENTRTRPRRTEPLAGKADFKRLLVERFLHEIDLLGHSALIGDGREAFVYM